MRKIAFALLLLALAGGVLVPTAAAEQLQANVVSWSPNAVQPGEPVSVVLQLYSPGSSPYPKDGNAVAGVSDVEVVIHGKGETRRFATDDLGGGRYSAQIIFPNPGGWDLRVSYSPGSYGPGDEILLGKGAICVGGELCAGAPLVQSSPAAGHGRPWSSLALAASVVLIVALVAAAVIRFGVFGHRRLPRGA